MNSPLSTSSRSWTVLRGEAPTLPPLVMLRANGHCGSAVKWVVPLGGGPGLRAEVPPYRDNEAWLARAEADLAGLAAGVVPEEEAGAEHLPADVVDRVFALAGEAGFPPDLRPGGDTCIPLGAGGEARLRALAGHPALWARALGALPQSAPCREAVCAFALAATADLRLVRASLVANGQLVWEVPLTDDFPPALVDHALNALATAVRCASREIEDLAADSDLASAWMLFHQNK